MIFPHRYTRSLLVLSLILLIIGIWMWVGNAGNNGAPELSDEDSIAIGTLALRIPESMIWTEGAPWKRQVGEYMVGDAAIVGYVTYANEMPFPGTNFFDGFLQIATAQTTESVCTVSQRDGEGNAVPMEESTPIDGHAAYVTPFNGAAAGTFMESRVTHIYDDGTCYELSANVFSGNIGNYPEGSVSEFPKEEVMGAFQHIIDNAIIN